MRQSKPPPTAQAASLQPWGALPDGCVVVVDTAPIIYLLQDHPLHLPKFIGLFEADAGGRLRIAISTVTLAEVLAGPFRDGQDALASRYEKALLRYQVVPLDAAVAVASARLRSRYGLKLPDAVQLATALEIGAEALVTHDRDFSKVTGMQIVTG